MKNVHQLKEGALISVTGDERIIILYQKTIRNTCRDSSKGQDLESLETEIIMMYSLKEYVANKQESIVNGWGAKGKTVQRSM